MKKLFPLILLFATVLLVSCGRDKNANQNTDVTPGTPIENSAQSAKICEPFIKYLECSIEKSPEAKRETAQKALDDTKARIQNDDPARIAQTCETYMKIMTDNPEISFKNGCTLETETPTPEDTTATQPE